jgi:uncharacterized membrane protein (UPF0127 family)
MIEVKGIQKQIGLMFKKSNHESLIFNFEKPTRKFIHSFFVFHTFEATFFLEDSNVERFIVKPFTLFIRPSKPYTCLIEVFVYPKPYPKQI